MKEDSIISSWKRERDLKLILSAFAKIVRWPLDSMIENESNIFPFGSFSNNNSNNNNNNSNSNNSHNTKNSKEIEDHNANSQRLRRSYSDTLQKSPSNDQSSNKIEEHDNDFALPDISPTFLQWVLLIQKLIDGNTPVSYTHLDVYKRQEYWSSNWKVCCEEMLKKSCCGIAC